MPPGVVTSHRYGHTGVQVDVAGKEAVTRVSGVGRVTGATIGVLTAAVALGTAELLAALFGPGSSPIVAVGGAAVDASPEWLKSFAIRTFGEHDKLALLIGIGVVLVAVVSVLGAASGRRPRLGIVGIVVLGAIGATAAVSRPSNDLADAIPSIAGAVVGVLAYRRLREAAGLTMGTSPDPDPGAAPEPVPAPVPTIPGYDRRRFLRTGVAAAGIAVAAGGLGRLLTSRSTAAASRAAATIPAPADAAPPLSDGADLDVPGGLPFLTPNAEFYRVDTALFVPALDAATWMLRLHGMVDREITLDFDQLLARPMIERDITLACVSNEVGGPYVGNARWIGAPLADLLREAGVRPDASQIVSRSADGFTIGTPTAVVLDGRDAMLAVSMNGEPLPLEHGFPVRMVVPGLYGYVSATKWLVDLELTTLDAYDAYWIQRGWAKEAPVKTQSRIDTPISHARLLPGPVAVAGVAWAQHRGIERIEVQVDSNGWEEAELGAADTIDTWRQWLYRWDASPGSHSLAVRATDGEGATQTAGRAAPFPDGATGYHTVLVEVT
jgi:DMSO/TMAO reductase YedYZ molybdopterin-dependent catalytic subunit